MSLWSRIANVFRDDRLTREIDEEFDSHIDEAIQQGRDPAEASRAFGSALRQREESRDARIVAWLGALRADAVFGWRQLMKRKVTSAAAIMSLALGTGACTAAFRLIDALLLRPLPVASPERLYVLARQGINPAGRFFVSESAEYPLFRRLRAAVKDQAELIAISYADRTDLTYGSDEDMEKAWRQYVSGWMFGSFGLKPDVGRLLTENDDVTPGAHPYAVLSYDYWTRRFGRDPKAIGRTFRAGNELFEIVGVAPPHFTGTETGLAIDIFLPTMMHPGVASADSSWLRPFVQLRPGVARQAAGERLRAVFQAWQEERAKGFSGRPKRMIDAFLHQKLLLEPAGSGISDIQKEYRSALAALGLLVALVLLIASANVANLMTAQATARAREMALRVSIGAGRWRMVQLVLVESAMLACVAAALGCLFAWWAAPFVAGRINPPDDPVRLFLPADCRVLAFVLAMTVGITCLFGLAPALRASAVEPAGALKGGEDPHGRRRTMHALIAAQAAFCFVVLFVAGLFVATLDRLSSQPTGFSSERLLTVDTVARRPQPPVLWDQAAEHLRETPGVEKVALAGWPLLSGNGWNSFVSIDGVSAGDSLAYFLAVSPGWLETMKIPLIDGRDLQAGDEFPSVAMVNEAFAKAYFGGEDPVGKWFEPWGSQRDRIRIVGLVRDARYRNMREPITATAYVPFARIDAQGAWVPQSSGAFIVRTSSRNPLAMASILRREVPRGRPEFRVSNISTQQELIARHTVRERLLAALALFFAAVAVLLGGVGMYGVLDYSVLQRRREISIRMAVGAPAGGIARLVTTDVFLMVLAGAVAGLLLGMASVRYIAALLYQVKPTGMAMLALPAVAILVVALLAALPAVFHAVRTDPAAMLRAE
ncbi:MAG: ABC transporter permease [Bryobacteraceae bacterium]|jgi:predicted permease